MTGRGRPGRWVRERVTNAARIARWEVTKNAGGIDRRTIAIAVVAMAALGAIAPLAASQGVALDSDIYRVGVEESSQYYEPAALDPTFSVAAPDRSAFQSERLDLYIDAPELDYHRSTKGRAALSELRSTVERYNDAVMTSEPNQSAAFPVVVNLTYRDRAAQTVIGAQSETLDTTGPGGVDGSDGGSGDGTSGDGGDGSASDGGSGDGSQSDGSGGPNLGGSSFGARLTGGTVSGTPSDIAPPFPFRSLVLAFIFILPLNFIIQAYGSTMLSERINRRGELLLVAPVSRGDIIVGKTLPYFLGAVAVAAVITVVLGGTVASVLAIVPLALLFLGATFLGAMFARSFKELTFVTVTITVSMTSYAFVPAIFTDVIPIALISPLTIVVRDLQGQAVGAGEFAFSTLPPTLSALVMFVLGAGLYREEDMFTQRPIPLKVLDSLAGPIRGRRSALKMSVLLIPFVIVAELVVIALLFALGEISIPLVLVAVAVVEELGKSLHVYAGYAHAKFDDRVRTALIVGALSGLGFFLAEKLSLLARLTGLPNLEIGQAALNTGIISGPLLLGFLLAPLALHVVTAAISAVGARSGRSAYATGLVVAITVHVAYNLAVVRLLVL